MTFSEVTSLFLLIYYKSFFIYLNVLAFSIRMYLKVSIRMERSYIYGWKRYLIYIM